jgi:hypothetical protein
MSFVCYCSCHAPSGFKLPSNKIPPQIMVPCGTCLALHDRVPLEDISPGLIASLEYLIAEYGLKGVQHALDAVAAVSA